MIFLKFKEWLYKTVGWCVACNGTKKDRRYQWRYIDGKMRGVRCQKPIHGERTIQPGQQCQDHEGNWVIMPD